MFIMNLRESNTYDIHFKYFNIKTQYWKKNKKIKNPQKVAKHLKMEKRVKQTIHTLDQHNYLVLSSGNLISIDSQGLYG